MDITIQLSYLDFESSDSGDDTQTLEAMATVAPARVGAVLAEVTDVLAWAQRHFPGGPQPLDEGGEWDLLLQAQVDDRPPVALHLATGQVVGLPLLPASGWVCVTLTLAGRPAFVQAVQDAIGL